MRAGRVEASLTENETGAQPHCVQAQRQRQDRSGISWRMSKMRERWITVDGWRDNLISRRDVDLPMCTTAIFEIFDGDSA